MSRAVRRGQVSEGALRAGARLEADAADLLVELLECEEVSRGELARRLGVTPPAVTHLLAGRDQPTLRRLAEVAHVLGYALRIEARKWA